MLQPKIDGKTVHITKDIWTRLKYLSIERDESLEKTVDFVLREWLDMFGDLSTSSHDKAMKGAADARSMGARTERDSDRSP